MRVLQGTIAVAMLLWSSVAGARPERSESLRVSLEELRAEVKSICLFALETELEVDGWPEQQAWFEEFLARKLAQSRFRVVMPRSVQTLSTLVAKEVGGSYDPHTGERDHTTAAAIERQVLARLRGELGCEAVLRPRLEEVVARWESGVARWDHVKHRMGPAVDATGTVGALSLFLELRALDGRILFERGGGVQTLVMLEGLRFRPLKPDERLRPDWRARAVVVALGDLVSLTPDVLSCLTAAHRKRMRSTTQHVGRPSRGELVQIVRWAQKDRRGMEAFGQCEVQYFQRVEPTPEER